jgi:formiminotetrahydrofolate cyclodeaminase
MATNAYLEQPLKEFLDEIASSEVAPGGGSVAAVAVAMAAGLVTMAARLSRTHWREAAGAAAQAETLRHRVTPLVELNVEAYLEAVSILRDRDDSAPQERDDEIGRALDRAAEVPLEIGRAAADVSALAALVAEQGEPSLRADVAAAALLSQAAARTAAALVEVNLTTTEGDARLVAAREFAAAAEQGAGQALASVA